jgi:diguanylate cyclase (GGDEF)-like protein
LVVFRSPLGVVIRHKRGVWRFTAAVVAVCLAYSLSATVVTDWLEGSSLRDFVIDQAFTTLNVFVLALPLAYYGARSNLALYEAKCQAERSSLTDSLTGLMNRRAFMQTSENQGDAQQALVIFDLDRFKRINDTHGHQVGDVVICRVAEALQSVLGAAGKVARVGGEEFALLAPPSAYDDLIVKLIDLRARIEAMPIEIDGGTIKTTISAGLALRVPGESFANLYRRADQALYAAKKAGRNCLRFNAGLGASEAIEEPQAAVSA